MKTIAFPFYILLAVLISCSDHKPTKKGFQVSRIVENEEGEKVVGLPIDSLNLETRPRHVLLTKHNEHRLTPIYKVNYTKKENKPYIGSTRFHSTWSNKTLGNVWNSNYMPGFEAAYGYNLINVSHYNNQTKKQNSLFERPVLIKTLYYPAFSNDTLNYEPVSRDYYMTSVYNEDTNKDGFINVKDLRRLFYFDIHGLNPKPLIPTNYSVLSSEYDEANDFMYVHAKLDKNKNGQMEVSEPTSIFWIDLKNPSNNGLHFHN